MTPQAKYQAKKRAQMTDEQRLAERQRLAGYNKSRNQKRYQENPEAAKARTKEWRERNPDKVRRSSRSNHLLRKYGMSLDGYDEMVVAQGGRCLVCQQTPPQPRKGPTLVVDHCHATGRVRGLLCQSCNLMVGQYEKLSAMGLLRRVSDYVGVT